MTYSSFPLMGPKKNREGTRRAGREEKLWAGLTSMFPPTLASSGGRGLSLSFLSPLRFGLRALATRKETNYAHLKWSIYSKHHTRLSETTKLKITNVTEDEDVLWRVLLLSYNFSVRMFDLRLIADPAEAFPLLTFTSNRFLGSVMLSERLQPKAVQRYV